MSKDIIQRKSDVTNLDHPRANYIKNKILSQPTGEHFNLAGHSLSDRTITVIEKVKKQETNYIKERESYFIRLFNTYYNGINKMP